MNFDEPQAIYLQIADYIAEKILTSEWPIEERIPSVREIAKTLKVNVNTVMRSYSFLQEKKIIENQRGIGYFVSESAKKLVTHWKQDQFINSELPRIFRQAQILEFSPDEMEKLYRQYLEKKS